MINAGKIWDDGVTDKGTNNSVFHNTHSSHSQLCTLCPIDSKSNRLDYYLLTSIRLCRVRSHFAPSSGVTPFSTSSTSASVSPACQSQSDEAGEIEREREREGGRTGIIIKDEEMRRMGEIGRAHKIGKKCKEEIERNQPEHIWHKSIHCPPHNGLQFVRQFYRICFRFFPHSDWHGPIWIHFLRSQLIALNPPSCQTNHHLQPIMSKHAAKNMLRLIERWTARTHTHAHKRFASSEKWFEATRPKQTVQHPRSISGGDVEREKKVQLFPLHLITTELRLSYQYISAIAYNSAWAMRLAVSFSKRYSKKKHSHHTPHFYVSRRRRKKPTDHKKNTPKLIESIETMSLPVMFLPFLAAPVLFQPENVRECVKPSEQWPRKVSPQCEWQHNFVAEERAIVRVWYAAATLRPWNLLFRFSSRIPKNTCRPSTPPHPRKSAKSSAIFFRGPSCKRCCEHHLGATIFQSAPRFVFEMAFSRWYFQGTSISLSANARTGKHHRSRGMIAMHCWCFN